MRVRGVREGWLMPIIKVTSAAAQEPVSLDEMKQHLRVEHMVEDGLISVLIAAARSHVEMILGRSLVSQGLELTLGSFPSGAIKLQRPPVASVASVTYRDSADVVQTLPPESYLLFPHDVEPLLMPAYGVAWPSTAVRPGAVQVAFTSGYESIPADIVVALKLLVGHLYRNREAVTEDKLKETPMGVDLLLQPYRTFGWI
jgi:uncharacterized phiE125 gp8 family phage protein